jgi:class 3 adenylate cyclase/pimeloyl-ACP methyl ester carboxylesterase
MEPQIHYTRTDDGVGIAYTTNGDGPPVLYSANQIVSMRHVLILEAGSAGMGRTKLTLFDHAGIGASQRDVSDFSLDAQVRTIEAVVARLAFDEITLVAGVTATASAALYACRHPQRVRGLACLHPTPPMVTDRTAAAMREDWPLAVRRWVSAVIPEGPIATQRWWGKAIRESSTAEVAAAYCEEFARADLREIYRQIPVPTLVCAASEGPDREGALALASLVPDCRVALGASGHPALFDFMGIEALPTDPSPSVPGDAPGTAIILFADIVDSTSLTERLGNAAFRYRSRQLEEALRAAIRGTGGAPVEGRTLGDGVLGDFSSAAQAIAAAIACREAAANVGLALHLGLHAGDVEREAGNLYGIAVNMASRISALTAPNEILVSSTVRDLARASTDVTFDDRGEHALKGIADHVRVFAVRLHE